MAFYDEKKIVKDADAYAVARFLGMKVTKRGIHNFIECPGHMKYVGHLDRKATNCWLTKKGCTCKACGHWYSLKEMVSCYKEYVEGSPVNYAQVLEIIAESCGRKEDYILKGKSFDYNSQKEKRIELSKEDCKILGLTCVNTPIFIPKECFSRKPSENHEITARFKNGEWEYSYYTMKKAETITLQTLLNENEEVFNDLIARKAKAAMENCKKALDFINTCEKNETQKEVYNILSKRYIRASEIYRFYSGEDIVVSTYKLDKIVWI